MKIGQSGTPADQRMQMHRHGQKYLRSGKHRTAIGVFEKALREHGSHLGLLSDLCAAQYLDGRYRDFRKNLVVLKNEYQAHREQLSHGSRLKTRIRLSNFLEEEGQISEALQLLRNGDAEAEFVDDTSYYRFLSHRLRLASLVALKDAAAFSDYSTLLRLRDHKPDEYFSVEIQQALMLAECVFFSPRTAFKRLTEALASPLLQADASLLVFDFAEEMLTNPRGADESLLPSIRTIARETACSGRFETVLRDILFDADFEAIEQVLQKPALDMSFSCILRACYAAQLRAPDTGLRRRFAHRLDFLLRSLDEHSQKLWRKKFTLSSHEAAVEIAWSARAKTLRFEDKIANLSGKPAVAKLLDLVATGSQIGTPDVIESLWNAPNDESYYRRLRTLVTRLNRILFELSGERNLLKINVEQISHSPKAKLIFAIS